MELFFTGNGFPVVRVQAKLYPYCNDWPTIALRVPDTFSFDAAILKKPVSDFPSSNVGKRQQADAQARAQKQEQDATGRRRENRMWKRPSS
jgi:hypothetical protein